MRTETIENSQMIGVRGDDVVIMKPKHIMTKQEALKHAAWLVAMADDDDEFKDFLDIIQNT